jgi:hypothetical protein
MIVIEMARLASLVSANMTRSCPRAGPEGGEPDERKAAVITRYGSPDVVKVLDVPTPEPAAGEILVRVHAATVNRTDCGELRAHPFFLRFFYGLRRPKHRIFGLDFAGEVEAVGTATRTFKPGDRVFGMCPSRSNGAQAEYVAAPETAVAAMPASLRFDQAVEAEQLRAIVDRKYALAAIGDAYRYVETGQKVGIVVIDVTAGGEGVHS